MSKIALITGATAGIGEACAHVFARERYDLILTGRRADRLETLSKQLIAEYNVHVKTLVFDVRDREDVISKLEELPEKWK
ncbi:MAG TPA: SDR family NAD(P)-dependent oxidoreductase, partial [Mucilaginibacter sp.]|nr:SDR family NAD(P)-dependent oxidoreductase [Mucilaginibacter sp.]